MGMPGRALAQPGLVWTELSWAEASSIVSRSSSASLALYLDNDPLFASWTCFKCARTHTRSPLTHFPLLPPALLGQSSFHSILLLLPPHHPQPSSTAISGHWSRDCSRDWSWGWFIGPQNKTKKKKERRLWKLLRYPEDMFSNFF